MAESLVLRFSVIFFERNFVTRKKVITFAESFGALAHLVERNTGSVEVIGSSPICSTGKDRHNPAGLFLLRDYEIDAMKFISDALPLQIASVKKKFSF